MRKTGHEDLLIRYVLGEATEEEQVLLEENFFTDEDSYQQLLALEDELRYEYAQGGLTRPQRLSFEKRFLATEADREKVALAKAVLAKAKEVAAGNAAARASVATPAVPWWRSLGSIFKLSSPGMRLAFNCAGLLLVAGGVWFMYQTARLRHQVEVLQAKRQSDESKARQQLASGEAVQQQLKQQLTEERERLDRMEKELAKRPSTSGFLSFILAPGLVRDTEGPKRLVIPADMGSVRFQLDVRSQTAFKSYRAELQTLDGAQIWSRSVARPLFEIPAALIPPGDYVIELHGTTPSGETETAGEFYFVVVRR